MNKPIAVVTGVNGALGRVIADTLIKEGYKVAGIDLGANPAASTLAGYCGNINLSDESATQTAFTALAKDLGPISALVNVAGGFVWETVLGGSADNWDRMWSTNVKTALNACRACVPLMGSEPGAIVNIGANAATKADLGMAAYTASKSGVARLTESLAIELKTQNIRINALLPSIIDTPANRADMPDADFNAWVKPQELADTCAFLLSPKASGITGALIPVTGRV